MDEQDPPPSLSRSSTMRAVKSKDTKPEMIVRRLVRRRGFGYRLHAKDLLGSPDLVFRGRRKVVFVHGCFWHSHPGCRRARLPKIRRDWWRKKLSGNVLRDVRNIRLLTELRWDSLVLWECEIADEKLTCDRLLRFLVNEAESYLVDKLPVKDDFPYDTQIESVPHRSRKEPPMNSAAQSKKQDASDELRLPHDFKAKTNVSAGTVRISKSRRSIEIPLIAYASVANVLAMFTENGRLNELPDGATLKLVDEFTGGSATFRADEIAAVTEAIDTFVAKTPKKRSSQSPKTTPSKATTPAAAKSSARNQTDLKVIETEKSEAQPIVEDAPWSSMLLPKVTDPDFDLHLVKLAVSPKKAKEVYGLATDKDIPKDAVILPGYDVKANGRHVCWVIAENEKTFHIEKTGFYAGSTHRALEGACARLKFGVIPNAS